MNYNDQIYNIVASFSKWRHSISWTRILFTPVQGVHLKNGDNEHALYVT